MTADPVCIFTTPRLAVSVAECRELACWKTDDWSVSWKRKVLGTGIECCLISTDLETVYAGDGIGNVGAFHAADGSPTAGWRWNRDRILNRAASTLAQSKDGRRLFVGAGQWHDEPVRNHEDGAVFVVEPINADVVFELPGVEGSIIVLSLGRRLDR